MTPSFHATRSSDRGFMLPLLRELVAVIHAQQCLSLHAERILEADGHVGRQGGATIEHGADRLAADTERFGELVDRYAVGLDDLSLQPLAGMDRERGVNIDSHQ